MKPDNWDTLKDSEQVDIAQRLINSTRGRLIVGQALAKAVKVMSQEKLLETSNIEDMEVLAVLFEPWFTMHLHPIDMEVIKAQLNQD